MLKKLKRKNFEWVLKNVPNVNEISDLVGETKEGAIHECSLLFLILCRFFKNSLGEKSYCTSQLIHSKKPIYRLFKALSPLFLNGKKIVNVRLDNIPENRPIIFASTHSFTEDIINGILLCGIHAFVVFGSLPVFYNTFDGLALHIFGSVLINRKNNNSRKALSGKCAEILKRGGNILIYPEGVWNKSANRITLDFWSGVFWIAKETDSLIIPEVQLPVDSIIYCSRLPAFDVSVYDDSQVNEALEDLRTIMNTELYSLMEKYAHTTREEIIGECESMTEAGEKFFQERVNSVGKYYDYPMEVSADYRPKDIIREVDVWKPIANIQPTKENLLHYLYAKDRVAVLEREDYQHRI